VGSRLISRLRRVPRPLALLLVVGALQAAAWDVALTPFQGPDEAGHFAYIQHLAETGHLPSATTGGTPNSSEEQSALNTLNLQSLIGDLGGRPAWTSADLSLWQRTLDSLPAGSRTNGDGPNPLAKNPPLYYALMSVPYRLFLWLPLLKRLFVMRLFNALCFLATILFTWLLAGEVFTVRWKQTLAAAVVALQPQLAFMSAVINADNLLIALVTAFMYAAVRLVKRGPSTAMVLSASGLAAAAVLTHGRGLVTLPVLAVALLATWLIHRPAPRDALRRGALAAGTVGGAFLAYLLFGRAGGSSSLYGGQVGQLSGSSSFNVKQFLSSIYQFYFPRLTTLQARIGPEYGYRQVFIDTFYGTFGSLEVNLRPRVYDALQVFSAVGLVGLYTALVARRRVLLRALPVVGVLLALLVTNLAFLHFVSYQALLGNGGSDPLIVGRYLLPMVCLFGLAIAFTVGSLPRRAGPILGAVVIAAGVLLSLTGIGMTVGRFYA
jgi:hypothetical protein